LDLVVTLPQPKKSLILYNIATSLECKEISKLKVSFLKSLDKIVVKLESPSENLVTQKGLSFALFVKVTTRLHSMKPRLKSEHETNPKNN
jgi:hypothetical protein